MHSPNMNPARFSPPGVLCRIYPDPDTEWTDGFTDFKLAAEI